ncbi:MucB/RseB C-terminal domain-containing protein [Saccharospirillum salsuginis]|uniref:Sigma factor AlgU regulatory protein MucB n=1 Tax=Saccharospirillum salsuginis TaxID=418750 RepID=A0A918KPT3_9GAMM|nr:MucB/RseB C-terminal domain-containing protein [Saccharospirillum salsuginis]GGX69803.1 sigma factor AlgU regulatory protein MucB [Saccharospirillum salsuginis]
MKRLLLVIVCLMSMPAFAMEWQWLNEMRSAIRDMSYQGEYLHRRGDETSVFSIAHATRDGEAVELLQQLDGSMIEVLREGDRVVCYYPKGSEDLVDRAIPAAPFSQMGPMQLERIAKSYRAMAMGEARVAGRDARVVSLSADDWRYQHKLWLDKATGLLLQSEIRGQDGTVLEQFRYTRLTIGEPVSDQALQPSLAKAQVRQQTQYRSEPEQPDAGGFVTEPGWLPPMFELEMTERHTGSDGWMEKRVYSDGLATFSVFVEPAMDEDPMDSQARMGATHAVMQQQGDLMVTVIGEIPVETARRLLSSVQRVQ